LPLSAAAFAPAPPWVFSFGEASEETGLIDGIMDALTFVSAWELLEFECSADRPVDDDGEDLGRNEVIGNEDVLRFDHAVDEFDQADTC